MKRLLFALAGVGIGVVVSLLLFELALRLIDWPSPGLYQDGVGPLPLQIATEEGGSWRRYPGPARVRHWDYDVEVHLNAHGFIERENAPKPSGTWRIGLFGDSFTAGMGVDPEDRFGRVWWRATAFDAGRPVEVYNFGSVWAGTAQNAAFLEAHGDSYALDEIVLAVFGGNELQDNEHWEMYRNLSEAERSRHDQRDQSWRDWVRNHSRAAGFLYVSLVRSFAKREVLVPTRAFVDEHWPPTRRAFEQFVKVAGERPLTVWYLPATTEWDDAAWREMRDRLGLDEADRHAVRDRIRAWVLAAGVPFVDTTPFLAGRSVADIRFPRDGHWNAAGHEIVGRALAETPRASHWQRRSSGTDEARTP